MNRGREKAARIKYMRLQEKLLQSSLTILKLENFNYELFEKKILKIYDKIDKIPAIRTDSSYLNSLKNFSELLIRTLQNEKLDISKKREILLKEANLIHKEKNKNIYKRQKRVQEEI